MTVCIRPERTQDGQKARRGGPLELLVRPAEGGVSARALRTLRGDHITVPKRAGTAEGTPTSRLDPAKSPKAPNYQRL